MALDMTPFTRLLPGLLVWWFAHLLLSAYLLSGLVERNLYPSRYEISAAGFSEGTTWIIRSLPTMTVVLARSLTAFFPDLC